MRALTFLTAASLAVLLSACSQTPVAMMPQGSIGVAQPDQIHAIPIATPPPTVNMCSGPAACHAQERTDVPAYPNSPALTPAQIPGLHPADLVNAYRLPSSALGTGTPTVAIVVAYADPNAASDLAVYRAKFGLPPCTPSTGCLKFFDQKPGNRSADPDWAAETAIDLDMVSATCPQCKIILARAASDSASDLIATLQAAIAMHPTVVSNSWSLLEGAVMPNVAGVSLAHRGVALVAGSGDSGAGTSWPAANSSVIAVGGTTLARDANSPRGWIEMGWRNAGFGCSQYAARPVWQPVGTCLTHRAIADIAAVADPATPVAIYNTYGPDKGHGGGAGGWEVYGGTSVATAVVAGAIGLAGGVNDLSNAQYIYAHAASLNAVAPTVSSLQVGLGSPNGIGAL